MRPEDPFYSASDNEGREDPFTEPDPFYSASDNEGREDPFTEPDPFYSASDNEGREDPFDPAPFIRSGAGRTIGPIPHGGRADRRLLVAGAALVAALLAAGVAASLSNGGGEASTTPDASPVPSTAPLTTLGAPTKPTPTSIAANGADAPQGADPAPDASAAPLGCDYQGDDDPHGLVRIDGITERLSFCGEETWQVFVCSTRVSDRTDRVSYVDDVLGEAAEWFDWASAGQYDIDFSAGDDTSEVSGSTAEPQECFDDVLRNQWSGSRSGAVVLVDEAALDPFQNYVGLGTCGYPSSSAGGVFGESGRMVAVAVHADGDQSAIAVHELGHAQCWPHSYSGETGSEYDNPADIMSYSQNWPVGTIAVNRYASGWIPPTAVRVHSESTDTYTLSPCCSGGVQLLALLPEEVPAQPVDFNRQWWHLEVRDPIDEWERGLADTEVGQQLGVSVHWIDQNLGMGAERRQAQVGNQIDFWVDAPVRFGQLKVAGSEFCLHPEQPTSFIDCSSAHEWRIEVSASPIGGLNLTVSPSR